MESAAYALEKWVWTEADFDQMGWHDVRVHAIAAITERFEILFDIDYILQWVAPVPPSAHYTFWVAPATLVFENVSGVSIELELQGGEFHVLDLARTDKQPSPNGKMTTWLWTIDGVQGSIRFVATGYKQYLRRKPVQAQGQELTHEQRGGLSFGRTVDTDDVRAS